jgi:hypothetical protein
MAENILKTRVLLKYDTLANWQADANKVRVLKAGEVGLVHIPEGTTTTADGKKVTTAPTVLFKVGDGTTQFHALPWASALAADVEGWAKLSWSDFVTKVQTEAGVVTATDFDEYKTAQAALIGTAADAADKETAFGKIAKAQAAAEAASELAGTKADAETTYTKDEVDDLLEGLTGTEGIAGVAEDLDELTTAFNTYKDTTAPAAYAAKSVETTKADKDSVYTKDEVYTKTEVDGIIDDVEALINGTDGLDTRVDALEVFKDTTVPGTYATKQELATEKAALIGTASDTDASDTIKGAKKYTDKAITDFVGAYITADDNGAIDKLNEVAAWINNDETGATQIVADIDALQTAVEELEKVDHDHTNKDELDLVKSGDVAKWDTAAGKAHEHENDTVLAGITAAKVEAWDKAEENAKSHATDLNDAMETRVAKLEEIDHAHTSSLEDIEDAVSKKHSHANSDVLNGITADKVAAWDAAEQTAKDYADDLDDSMDVRVSAIEDSYIRTEVTETEGQPDSMKLFIGKSEEEITLVISGGSASDVW